MVGVGEVVGGFDRPLKEVRGGWGGGWALERKGDGFGP